MLDKKNIQIMNIQEIQLNGEWVKFFLGAYRDGIYWSWQYYTADIGTLDSQLWKVVALKEEN